MGLCKNRLLTPQLSLQLLLFVFLRQPCCVLLTVLELTVVTTRLTEVNLERTVFLHLPFIPFILSYLLLTSCLFARISLHLFTYYFVHLYFIYIYFFFFLNCRHVYGGMGTVVAIKEQPRRLGFLLPCVSRIRLDRNHLHLLSRLTGPFARLLSLLHLFSTVAFSKLLTGAHPQHLKINRVIVEQAITQMLCDAIRKSCMHVCVPMACL